MQKLSYAKKQIIINRIKIIVVLGVLIIGLSICIRWIYKDIVAGVWSNERVVFASVYAVTGSLIMLVLVWLSRRLNDLTSDALLKLGNAIKGDEGEKQTLKKLQESLDERYKIYPNFVIPGKKFDLDVLIVGPKGILSIEVKNIGGIFDFIGDETYKHDRHNGNSCIDTLNEWRSPTRELIRHCAYLEMWLQHKGISNIKIKKVIVLAGNRHQVQKIENPSVFIATSVDRLGSYLQTVYDDPRFTPEFCDKVNRLLGN